MVITASSDGIPETTGDITGVDGILAEMLAGYCFPNAVDFSTEGMIGVDSGVANICVESFCWVECIILDIVGTDPNA